LTERSVFKECFEIVTFVVGFAIGAGILGLPIRFGVSGAGFLPSTAMLMLALTFQVLTAFYIIECIRAYGPLEFPELMREALGPAAAALSYLSIALLLTSAMTAYLIFGGVAASTLSGYSIPTWAGIVAYWMLGVVVVIGGRRAIASAEGAMVAALAALLILNAVMCATNSSADVSNLAWGRWDRTLDVFGIVLFAYAIHAAIPTAYRTFGGGSRYPKLVASGFLLSAAIYVLWSAAYMLIIRPNEYFTPFVGAPSGKLYNGLDGLPAPIAVAELGKLPEAYLLGYAFGYLTTLTSFIAAAHTFKQINESYFRKMGKWGDAASLTIALASPLALALLNLASFIQWLSFAGAVGASMYSGILPSLAAIKLRLTSRKDVLIAPKSIAFAAVSLVFYSAGLAWFIANP